MSTIDSMSTIEERVIKIVCKYLEKADGIDPQSVNLSSQFVEDLKLDSLSNVEMIMSMEEEFGIEIADDAAEKIKTVGDAVEYIKSQIDSESGSSPDS